MLVYVVRETRLLWLTKGGTSGKSAEGVEPSISKVVVWRNRVSVSLFFSTWFWSNRWTPAKQISWGSARREGVNEFMNIMNLGCNVPVLLRVTQPLVVRGNRFHLLIWTVYSSINITNDFNYRWLCAVRVNLVKRTVDRLRGCCGLLNFASYVTESDCEI